MIRNRRNMSVSDVIMPTYRRDINKFEGSIKPNTSIYSTIKFSKELNTT